MAQRMFGPLDRYKSELCWPATGVREEL